ncbi:MAG: 16S rRNA (cytosine(967)-C(5))-methyltransferase [Spirulina sp. DLM2.Bin59]|nr:MAG: 16S rRNA (cytosine(967)-C(5))-methyltransferase [Spirulina sp. DLM2.Bin59]
MNPRHLALITLQQIDRHGAYTDIALDRTLGKTPDLPKPDRALVTELVYGVVRRQRTLNAIIDHLGTKPAQAQPPLLRTILQLGLYQLRYLDHVPPSAAVDTSVELAKTNGQGRLTKVVNGLLRNYLRQIEAGNDPLTLPADPMERLGITASFPDWMVGQWWGELGEEEAIALCDWFNQAPVIDLRVNPLKSDPATVQAALLESGVKAQTVPGLPRALRLPGSVGAIPKLPGFRRGWWTVQDSSAQWVGALLDPQPGETIIDACGAPGGKTTDMAERMGDVGTVIACDRTPHRLEKVRQNAQRLGLTCIETHLGDSATRGDFVGWADRLLLDVPCSGLGTLHRHPDIRWRQTPENIAQLTQLQKQLLANTARWLKPGGRLVYATCTLNPPENEAIIEDFLKDHPNWQISPPGPEFAPFASPEGWVKIWPHRAQMDGFFMVAIAAPA